MSLGLSGYYFPLPTPKASPILPQTDRDWETISTPLYSTDSETVAETSVIAAGVGSLTMPPGFWYPGREVRIESKGVYTTPLILSELTLRIKLGSVLLSSLLTSALITSASRESFALQAAIVCESVGVNGMVRIGGNIN